VRRSTYAIVMCAALWALRQGTAIGRNLHPILRLFAAMRCYSIVGEGDIPVLPGSTVRCGRCADTERALCEACGVLAFAWGGGVTEQTEFAGLVAGPMARSHGMHSATSGPANLALACVSTGALSLLIVCFACKDITCF